MRVLICPDKFRGTVTAAQAAAAIEGGWRRARPGDVLDVAPMADGGEGTLDAFLGGGGRAIATRAAGPRGNTVDAVFAVLPDGTAVIESARAIGLSLLDPARRDPRRTTSRGVGDLLRCAFDQGASRVLVCLGGSATNDAGVGMAAALGARFLDAQGRPIPDGGQALLGLTHVDLTGLDHRLRTIDIVGLTDVRNPLCGPSGASVTFAPQKGATEGDAWMLDRALAHLAAVTARDIGVSFSDEPGAGAAGGLGFGLAAFCGASLRSGAEEVARTLRLERRAADADLVITGEGAVDASSFEGKVVGTVLGLADVVRTPAVVLCGRAEVAPPGVDLVSLTATQGADAALGNARLALERAAEEVGRRIEEAA
jgi:glycerate 2-kinase